MHSVSRAEFEKLVSDGLSSIAPRFQEKLRNVVFKIEKWPSKTQLAENNVPSEDTLLGLFEGPTAGDQGSGTWELPPVITIFQGPSEEEAMDGKELAQIVRETVWHEVAHYFGMEEEEVLSAEVRRRENY